MQCRCNEEMRISVAQKLLRRVFITIMLLLFLSPSSKALVSAASRRGFIPFVCNSNPRNHSRAICERFATLNMASAPSDTTSNTAINVLGGPLHLCCTSPKTGYFRDGFCHTGPTDQGMHTVCAVVTDEFLQYSRSRGNDLITPMPQYGFPGLKAGDKWCLCVSRWKESLDAGVAPRVLLASTHKKALEVVKLEDLRSHAVDP